MASGQQKDNPMTTYGASYLIQQSAIIEIQWETDIELRRLTGNKIWRQEDTMILHEVFAKIQQEAEERAKQ